MRSFIVTESNGVLVYDSDGVWLTVVLDELYEPRVSTSGVVRWTRHRQDGLTGALRNPLSLPERWVLKLLG